MNALPQTRRVVLCDAIAKRGAPCHVLPDGMAPGLEFALSQLYGEQA